MTQEPRTLGDSTQDTPTDLNALERLVAAAVLPVPMYPEQLLALIARVREAEAALRLTRGAMAADDARLLAAEARVWPDGLSFDCDGADHLADEILTLRARVQALEAALTQVEALYSRDRVAHQHARELERIFDEALHGGLP